MDKQQERELHKAIDRVLSDNLSPLVNRAGIVGLRELILDAIDFAGFDIIAPSATPVTGEERSTEDMTLDW